MPRMPRGSKPAARQPKQAKIVTESPTHSIKVVTADALEEVRDLEKTLVRDQADLFKSQLFIRSCRVADFCLALGAYEKDSQFFREYSYIVANRS